MENQRGIALGIDPTSDELDDSTKDSPANTGAAAKHQQRPHPAQLAQPFARDVGCAGRDGGPDPPHQPRRQRRSSRIRFRPRWSIPVSAACWDRCPDLLQASRNENRRRHAAHSGSQQHQEPARKGRAPVRRWWRCAPTAAVAGARHRQDRRPAMDTERTVKRATVSTLRSAASDRQISWCCNK